MIEANHDDAGLDRDKELNDAAAELGSAVSRLVGHTQPGALTPHQKRERDRVRAILSRDRVAAASREVVTEETEQQGDYERHNGIQINHRASPLTRWKSSGDLTEGHLCAIAWCQKRWALLASEASMTSNYDERVSAGTSDGESGGMILARMEARDEMRRVCGGIGPAGEFVPGYIPRTYWSIFENCIRFDRPAGDEGRRLLGKSAPSARALTAVQFVADIIVMNERLTY